MRYLIAIISLFFIHSSFASNETIEVAKILLQAEKEIAPRKKGELYVHAFEHYHNRIIDADTFARKVLKYLAEHDFKDLQARTFVRYAEVCNWLGQYARTDSCVQNAKPYLIEFKQDSLLGRLLIEESIAKRRRLNFLEAKSAILSAISIFQNGEYHHDLAYAFCQYSNLLGAVDDTEGAMEYAQKAYNLADSLNSVRYLGHSRLLLAQLTTTKNDSIQKRESLLLGALRDAEQLNDCILKGLVQMSLIFHYSDVKKYDEALVYWDKIVENDRCQGKPEGYEKYYIYHRKAYLFLKKRDYHKALELYLKDYNILKWELGVDSVDFGKVNNQYLKAFPRNLMPIAKCYFELGQYDTSEYWCYHSLEAFELLKSQDGKAQVYILLSEIEKTKDNFEKALEFFEKSISLKDSTQSKSRFESVKKIEAKYENGRLTKENKLLAKEKELIEAKAFQGKVISISVGIIAIMIILVIWLILQQKRKNEKMQKEEVEQRFLRSQLNPHFFFNSLVSIHNFVTENKSEEAGRYLIKFSKLMRSILEHSRLETIPLNEEIIALTSYLELQQLRTNNLFDFEFIIDEEMEVDFINIPPMLLQPIIENSIEHGFRGINYKGLIQIKVTDLKTWLEVIITDNGVGRKASKEYKSKLKQTSLSTTINAERIQLFNKNKQRKISFDIEDLKVPTGTKVIIKIPIE